jgi:hypothetical protein
MLALATGSATIVRKVDALRIVAGGSPPQSPVSVGARGAYVTIPTIVRHSWYQAVRRDPMIPAWRRVISSLARTQPAKETTVADIDYDQFMAMLNAPEEPAPAKPAQPVTPAQASELLSPGEALEELSGLAIKRIHQVLEPEVDLSNEKMTKLQLAAAGTALNTQVKVDENRLRKRKLDVLPKLIELIAEERARLAAEELAHAEQAVAEETRITSAREENTFELRGAEARANGQKPRLVASTTITAKPAEASPEASRRPKNAYP